jgi:hypothetical protein
VSLTTAQHGSATPLTVERGHQSGG